MKRKSVECLNAFFVLFLRQRAGRRGTPSRAGAVGRSAVRNGQMPQAVFGQGGRPGGRRIPLRCIPFRSEGAYPEALAGGRKTSRTVCPACFESCAGRLFSGAGRWRRCGCEADLRRLFPDLLCYLFRYLSRYIFSSRGMTGLVMNPLHPASSAVRRSVSKA